MLHVFQIPGPAGTPPNEDNGRGLRRRDSSKRVTVSNACVECRRRKIKCDGVDPCCQCEYYQETCVYAKPAPRVPLSKKLVNRLQAERGQYQTLVSRLFGNENIQDLVGLSRADLVKIATKSAAAASPSSGSESDGLFAQERSRPSESAESLDLLEPKSNLDVDHDGSEYFQRQIKGIVDGTSGLSFYTDQQSSHASVSSLATCLRIIVKIAPITQDFLGSEPDEDSQKPVFPKEEPELYKLPKLEEGQQLVDSFFARVHPFMPMLGESDFRRAYSESRRKDSPWLALLNMVFALGSLSSSTSANQNHTTYYQRARHHLSLESFGSSSIDVLHALSLLGGSYLHWLNRRNEANGIMGAALRMALALGLHREYGGSNRKGTIYHETGQRDTIMADDPDVRRRTWWSIYCLDSWASLSTGRPSLGREGPGIMVHNPGLPEYGTSNMGNNTEALKLLPIIYNTSLCKIATKVQDYLAASPLVDFSTVIALNTELEKWYDELPVILTFDRKISSSGSSISDGGASSSSPVLFRPSATDHDYPDILKTPRAVMHWRWHNVRMLLHRPSLLAAALRRTPFPHLAPEEQWSVTQCRAVAGESLAHIERHLQDNLIAGWNAVWLAHQAVMVPLVSLFAVLTEPGRSTTVTNRSPDTNQAAKHVRDGRAEISECRAQVEAAMRIFERMQPYSAAARHNREMVQRLYDASIYIEEQHQQHQRQEHQQLQSVAIQPAGHMTQYFVQQQPIQHLAQPLHPLSQHQHFGPSTALSLPMHSTAPVPQMQMDTAYDANAWRFQVHHQQQLQAQPAAPMSFSLASLEALEWDGSAPPGDMNPFIDAAFGYGGASTDAAQQPSAQNMQDSAGAPSRGGGSGAPGTGSTAGDDAEMDWGRAISWHDA